MDTVAASNAKSKLQWPGGPSIKQNFSIPDTLIYSMSKNPSTPKAYNKLIQSCKSCFEYNPIIVAASIYDHSDSLKICSNNCRICQTTYGKCCTVIDLNKFSAKLWLTNKIVFYGNNAPNYISLLGPKIFRSDIDELFLQEKCINFDDFKFYASTLKTINFQCVSMIYKDGNSVMLENILEVLPNVENFNFTFPKIFNGVNASTMKKILELKNLENLKFFRLENVPAVLNANDFTKFITNYNETLTIIFRDPISEEYKIQLDTVVDTIIESNLDKCIIYYSGQDGDKLQIMRRM